MTHTLTHLRRMVGLLATVALGTTLHSCTLRPGAAGEPELGHDSLKVVSPPATTLTESSVLAIPTDMAVVGDYLALIDIASDSALHVIDRVQGGLVRSLGRRGDGPGEFNGAWSLDPAKGDGDFWVFDVALRRLSLVHADPRASTPIARDRLIHFRSASNPTGPVWTRDGTLVSLGFHPSGRLAVYDDGGEEIGLIGHPPGHEGNAPASVLQHAYQATLAPHPDRDRVAVVTRHASQLELWAVDGSANRIVEGPLRVTPDLESSSKLSSDEFVMRASGRIGYVDIAASDEFVFALFSGRTLRGFKQAASFGRFVHVFDWEGNFLYALRLEGDAIAIAVDRASATLYAVRHDPTPAVDAYSLESTRTQILAGDFN